MRQYILDQGFKEIEEYVKSSGESLFRAKQVFQWIFKKRAAEFSAMSNVPAPFRHKLEKDFNLRSFKLKSKQESKLDGTIRFEFISYDGLTIPAVFLPSRDRNVVCISSQAGCPVSCVFCSSGKVKFKRNLSKGEMIEQIFQIEANTGIKIDGVLFMGMGEPFLNYDNLVLALKTILDRDMMGVGRRHVTVSTVGVVPLIKKFQNEKLDVRLAISLHAPDDELRKKLIPNSGKYSIKEIIRAAIEYADLTNTRLTVEYILIADVTCTLLSAQKLVKLLEPKHGSKSEIQINLIPYNPGSGLKYEVPGREKVEEFKNYLINKGFLAIVREAKGRDISAACGQLGV